MIELRQEASLRITSVDGKRGTSPLSFSLFSFPLLFFSGGLDEQVWAYALSTNQARRVCGLVLRARSTGGVDRLPFSFFFLFSFFFPLPEFRELSARDWFGDSDGGGASPNTGESTGCERSLSPFFLFFLPNSLAKRECKRQKEHQG